MDYVIYTYGGNGELVAQIFNGIARLFASNSEYFTAVGRLSMSIGAIWAATRAIFSTNIGIFAKHWFFPTLAVFTLLFSLKTTVVINDKITRTNYTVANIPFGVAFFLQCLQ
jgi:conjugal transfer mating pair stabilization protein TraG